MDYRQKLAISNAFEDIFLAYLHGCSTEQALDISPSPQTTPAQFAEPTPVPSSAKKSKTKRPGARVRFSTRKSIAKTRNKQFPQLEHTQSNINTQQHDENKIPEDDIWGIMFPELRTGQE
eukprot:c6020_g1_i1.p1 GENE.c6020_g1_i1~~c6020_g1_i1.p1  ORF type:complete len:120 (+),score=23.40 c6020_g1_i1:59-418(+)